MHCRCCHQRREYQQWSKRCGRHPPRVLSLSFQEGMRQDNSCNVYVPTLTGLIRIPSSTWAVSGESETLWAKTSDSQRVLTKVVRPVPEEPGGSVNDAKQVTTIELTCLRP